jgi:integrase
MILPCSGKRAWHQATEQQDLARVHSTDARRRNSANLLRSHRFDTRTIHHGRHTLISHALAGERSLAEVRDAFGHTIVSITSAYRYVAVDDETIVGNLFRLAESNPPPSVNR